MVLPRCVVAAALAALIAGCTDSGATDRGDDAGGSTATTALESRDQSGLRVDVGDLSAPEPVVPMPTGSEPAGVDRDAGVSAELRDGSVVWFFGDTAARNPDWTLRYFHIGSAAWAPADAPTSTIDVTIGSEPVPFVRPTRRFPSCPPEASTPGMWPLAAVVDGRGSRDRVVLWMANICLGPDRAAVGRGVSVGEWFYDPATPPVDGPIQVDVLNQALFGVDEPAFGHAALPDGTDAAYVYGCRKRVGTSEMGGPCHVARVRLDEVADPSAYRVWTGGGWSGSAAPEPLVLAGKGDRTSIPPGPFSVVTEPVSGAVVMAYSPWPGYVGQVNLRVAPDPQGPFGEEITVPLPECEQDLEGSRRSCYAANVQPYLTDEAHLGIGWYDQMIDPDSPKGGFLVARVPITVGNAEG